MFLYVVREKREIAADLSRPLAGDERESERDVSRRERDARINKEWSERCFAPVKKFVVRDALPEKSKRPSNARF